MIQTSSRLVYRNQWLSLREDAIELPDGSPGIYTVIDKTPAVAVIAIEGDGFHLVQQYRYPVQHRSWEFVQGTWPDDRVAPLEELARAELAEETGLRARNWHRLGRVDIAPGLTSQTTDVFIADDLAAGPTAREHTEQGMLTAWIARAEFEQMARTGQITDGVTLAAYALFQLHQG